MEQEQGESSIWHRIGNLFRRNRQPPVKPIILPKDPYITKEIPTERKTQEIPEPDDNVEETKPA